MNKVTWLPAGRSVKKYSFESFQREFTEARPDLKDVRGYNVQMLDIFSTLRPITGVSILDVGASPHGFALEHALRLGVAEYCGIGLGIAADAMVEFEGGVGVLLGMNADNLEFPDSTFDRIITLSTFEHFFHPDQVLREFVRVLKPGGAVLVNFQPIWTSLQGHHLHHIPAIAKLLPPFSHLRWDREQMRSNLRATWPQEATMSLDEVVTWIYDSDEINRIPVNILRQRFLECDFHIEWITPLLDEWTADEESGAQAAAQIAGLPAGELAIKGFSLLMVKK
jgi:SAM-dependent methyltransferase